MSFYNLKKGVYIIKGACKHCIYNSNEGIVYHINTDTLEFIETIHEDSFNIDSFPDELKLLQELENAQLIELAQHKADFPDIQNEITKKPKIDFAWLEVTKRCNLQ